MKGDCGTICELNDTALALNKLLNFQFSNSGVHVDQKHTLSEKFKQACIVI